MAAEGGFFIYGTASTSMVQQRPPNDGYETGDGIVQ